MMKENVFRSLTQGLGEVLIDPAAWPSLLDDISTYAGARGATLLQGENRTADIPRSVGVAGAIDEYFEAGWYAHDVRAVRSVERYARGQAVISDQDILTPGELGRETLYRDLLARHDLPWFAAVPFRAGATVWGLVIHRTARQGAFSPEEQAALARLAPRLDEMAALSVATGRAALAGSLDALAAVEKAAVAVDHFGRVVGLNAAASALLGPDMRVSGGRLRLADRRAQAALEQLCDRARSTPDSVALPTEPIAVRRPRRPPLVIRPLPVSGPARAPFLGARLLLVISDLGAAPAAPGERLAAVFRLSPAEARLAGHLLEGRSLDRCADALGVSRETVRAQLKAIFSKTETHRQGELIALGARL